MRKVEDDAMKKCLSDLQRRLGVRNGIFVLDDLIQYAEIGDTKDTQWERRTGDETFKCGETTDSGLRLTVD